MAAQITHIKILGGGDVGVAEEFLGGADIGRAGAIAHGDLAAGVAAEFVDGFLGGPAQAAQPMATAAEDVIKAFVVGAGEDVGVWLEGADVRGEFIPRAELAAHPGEAVVFGEFIAGDIPDAVDLDEPTGLGLADLAFAQSKSQCEPHGDK